MVYNFLFEHFPCLSYKKKNELKDNLWPNLNPSSVLFISLKSKMHCCVILLLLYLSGSDYAINIDRVFLNE